MKKLFTPKLVPMMKLDLRQKVECGLSIRLDQLEGMPGTDGDDTEPSVGSIGSGANDNHPGDTEQLASTGSVLDEGEQDEIEEPTSAKNKADELGEADSGFGLDGKPVCWTDKMFWNYVDYMLNVLRATAREDTTSQEEYETSVREYVCFLLVSSLSLK